jgi:chemotaxis protein MotB
MRLDGIREDQVTQVRGFAHQRLRKKEDPLDAANRRISLIVQYLNRPDDKTGGNTRKKSADKSGEKDSHAPSVATEKTDPSSAEKKQQ